MEINLASISGVEVGDENKDFSSHPKKSEINNEVVSVDFLYQKLKQEFSLTNNDEIINVLNELASERIIYHNDNYSEIVSIVNINSETDSFFY